MPEQHVHCDECYELGHDDAMEELRKELTLTRLNRDFLAEQLEAARQENTELRRRWHRH